MSDTSYPTKITVSELAGEHKYTLIHFLANLEQRRMLWSKMEVTLDGSKMERVWYGYDSSPTTKTGGEE